MLQEGFWPTNARDWVGLALGAIGIGSTVGGLLSWWLRTKLNGLGKRLRVTETSCTETKTEVAALKERMVESEHDRESMQKDITRMEVVQVSILDKLNAAEKATAEHRLDQAERLARIETKLDVLRQTTENERR